MPWVRIDEEFPHHPKVSTVGPLGIAVQVAALCYSNRYLTDGYIPFGVVRTLLDFNRLGEDIGDNDEHWVEVGPMNIAQRLVKAGMWEEVDGGFLIHDFHHYQPSRVQVEAERKKTKERVAKYRENKRKGGNSSSSASGNKGSNPGRNAVTNGSETAAPVPVPPSLPSSPDLNPFLTVVGVDPDQPKQTKGQGKGKPPRTPRHPTDEYVISRARQIQAESGPDAAKAYLRKVGENYGQASREDQLQRLEALMAQDAAEEAGP